MLIYKTPARIIYNTDNGCAIEAEISQIRLLGTLCGHDQSIKSDKDILAQFFDESHPVWVDFGQSDYWACEFKAPSISMSHEAALRIMMQVSAGKDVPLTDMAAWMGAAPADLRAHLRTLADEYLEQMARYYQMRSEARKHIWQISDERFADKNIRFAYAECVFIVKKMLPGIA